MTTYLSFTLSKIGVYTFKVFFGHHQIYEKRFIVEDVLEDDYYIPRKKHNPVCFQRPENISIQMMEIPLSLNVKI